jgi:dipeptidyl aminopeptidase/acylaminoacyl peptidase
MQHFLLIRLVSCLFAVAAFSGAALGDPLPADIYAALPQIEGPRLSPDGKSVAMISPRAGGVAVRVWRSDGVENWFTPVDSDQINWIAWKGSDSLLFSLRASEQEGNQPMVGLSRLVFYTVSDKRFTRVTFRESPPPPHVRVINRQIYHQPNVQDRVISMMPGDPDHILLAATLEDGGHPEALVVNVKQGEPKSLLRPSGNVMKWLADGEGTIRLKTLLDDNGSTLTFQTRDDDRSDWRTIHHLEIDHGSRFIPLAFSRTVPSRLMVLADQENGRLALQEMDLRTEVMGPVLASDPQCDIDPVIHDDQVVGYTDLCHDETETYFDADWQAEQAMLRRALKTPLVAILDRTADGKFSVIKSAAAPGVPPAYWYFDQPSKTLTHLADSYEKLKVDTIAPARKVSIAAGDGTILPALLTLPLDPPAGPIGFVVLPHGGPNAHDSLQFDWIVQFIASRGYGVLQPQFRGSSGYGSAFQRAGYREWGGRMQDDVTDATRWLIDQKLADPKRLCIVGSSYGGYAALTGAAQHPDLYRCVAAIAPVTDVEKLLHDREHIEFVEANRNRIAGTSGTVGIPSPVDLAGAISAPVLLIHGKRDFTVPVAHSEEMAARLREAGHKPVVVYIDDSDHFFSHPGGRLQALKALDSFLNANLGADPGRRS